MRPLELAPSATAPSPPQLGHCCRYISTIDTHDHIVLCKVLPIICCHLYWLSFPITRALRTKDSYKSANFHENIVLRIMLDKTFISSFHEYIKKWKSCVFPSVQSATGNKVFLYFFYLYNRWYIASERNITYLRIGRSIELFMRPLLRIKFAITSKALTSLAFTIKLVILYV